MYFARVVRTVSLKKWLKPLIFTIFYNPRFKPWAIKKRVFKPQVVKEFEQIFIRKIGSIEIRK
jgi:hypothetical protein